MQDIPSFSKICYTSETEVRNKTSGTEVAEAKDFAVADLKISIDSWKLDDSRKNSGAHGIFLDDT